MKYWNKSTALKFTLLYLRSKFYRGVEIVNRNRFSHAYIRTKKQNFYWLFKKDFFHSFNYVFPEYIKKNGAISGVAESINIEYLKYCLNTNSTLLFCHEQLPRAIYTPSQKKLLGLLKTVYPHGDLNECPATALLKIYCDFYGLKREQDRENTYKTNDYTSGTVVVQEQTYSFPFKLMERLK